MPSVFKTIARAVVQELDAAGDMIEVRSVLDADKFHCFCLVMGTNTRHFYRTDLTLEDILESDEGEGQCDELDFGLPGQYEVQERWPDRKPGPLLLRPTLNSPLPATKSTSQQRYCRICMNTSA